MIEKKVEGYDTKFNVCEAETDVVCALLLLSEGRGTDSISSWRLAIAKISLLR